MNKTSSNALLLFFIYMLDHKCTLLMTFVCTGQLMVLMICENFYTSFSFGLFPTRGRHSRYLHFYDMAFVLRPDALPATNPLFRGKTGPPVFHIKVGAFRKVSCPRTQQANSPACSSQPPLNAERQTGKL